jgi:TetR/AcrR family transcriptional repressor of lmrAB and yxaGH operons
VAGDVRQRMVDSAVRLLAERGLQGTSFADVLERARAPRGSVYHHFPDGKDQLVGDAVELAGARTHDFLAKLDGAAAEEVTTVFLSLWRLVLEKSGFGAGCAVLAVTVATDSPDLLHRTAAVFRDWRSQLAGLLERGGLPADRAGRFAALLVAASEGAVVLSRAERSMEPFDLVAEQLLDEVRRA